MGRANGGSGNVIPLQSGKRDPVDEAEGPRAAPSLLDAIAVSQALPPWLSARRTPTIFQYVVFILMVTGLAFALGRAPALTLASLKIAAWSLFFVVVCWRFALAIAGVISRDRPQETAPVTPDADLPVYSVLVALRHEANMMTQLAASLSAIDWPADRLDVILLIEADDEGTRRAAMAADFPPDTRILTVPPGRPLTKPRALNFGLAEAEGDFVVIYDAEDRPHPGQLKAAYASLSGGGGWAVAAQAPLYASNGAASWMAAHWALEYQVQFGLIVPALARLGYPVMFGGTSNHFRGLM